jgi:hypothetical protein
LLPPERHDPSGLTEPAIDEAFAGMADDSDYHKHSIKLTSEFETRDAEVFQGSWSEEL